MKGNGRYEGCGSSQIEVGGLRWCIQVRYSTWKDEMGDGEES